MRDRREPKFLSPEAVNGHLGAGDGGGSGGGWSVQAAAALLYRNRDLQPAWRAVDLFA
jgi:hypothetical protein